MSPCSEGAGAGDFARIWSALVEELASVAVGEDEGKDCPENQDI